MKTVIFLAAFATLAVVGCNRPDVVDDTNVFTPADVVYPSEDAVDAAPVTAETPEGEVAPELEGEAITDEVLVDQPADEAADAADEAADEVTPH